MRHWTVTLDKHEVTVAADDMTIERGTLVFWVQGEFRNIISQAFAPGFWFHAEALP